MSKSGILAQNPPPHGHWRWFERLLEELRIELWRGDATVIRAKRGRKKKTDREYARHILKLLMKDDFPRGLWTGSCWQTIQLPPMQLVLA